MATLFNHIVLDRETPIPLYYQLRKQIIELIESGYLKEGDMLPGENDICKSLLISRPTVRQAMAELVDGGYISRHKGKGTFISKPKVKDRFLSQLQSFNNEMREKGMTPKTKVLAVGKVKGFPEANENLKLEYSEPLIYLSRLRFADNVPMVYVETYLPYKGFEVLLSSDFTQESLYSLLEKYLSIRIVYARREIEAVEARQKEAQLLDIELGAPISLVCSLACTEEKDSPVEYSIARYRGDRTKFVVDTYRYDEPRLR